MKLGTSIMVQSAPDKPDLPLAFTTDDSSEGTPDETESRARDEIARGFPTKAAFDRMIERCPIPPASNDEPDWIAEVQ
jgi:hypothetical protein